MLVDFCASNLGIFGHCLSDKKKFTCSNFSLPMAIAKGYKCY